MIADADRRKLVVMHKAMAHAAHVAPLAIRVGVFEFPRERVCLFADLGQRH